VAGIVLDQIETVTRASSRRTATSGSSPALAKRRWFVPSAPVARTIIAPRNWLIGGAYVLAYAALDWISYDHTSSSGGFTPWNPSPGLSLVLLLRGGLGFAPWLVVAAATADIVVRGLSIWHQIIGAALITAFIHTAAAVLLRKLGLDITLSRVRDVIMLLLVAIGASGATAFLLIGLYVAEGQISASNAASAVLRWVCDSSGILVATPALLRVGRLTFARARMQLARADLETMLQTTGLVLALWFVFVHESTDQFKFFYLLLLPMIWIALRHGIDGACIASLGVQTGLMVLAHYRGLATDVIVDFHTLTLLPTTVGLIIGAIAEERAAAEEALRRQQVALAHVSRVSVAGEMVSALAHELSQPLVATETYIAEIQRHIELGAETKVLAEPVALAANQARRAGEVLARLRKFLYRGEVTLTRVPVQTVLAEAIGLVKGESALQRIEIQQSMETTPVPILVDSVQIEQVVVNLVRNAIEAVVDAAPPARRIEIYQRTCGSVVEIAVTDTGPGLLPEIESRLFHAFATTKPHGMGLGLAISRSILEAHGGALRYERRDGRGATFIITLPRADDVA
jgi:two-component system, LuxR family, sensor kinase FixL